MVSQNVAVIVSGKKIVKGTGALTKIGKNG